MSMRKRKVIDVSQKLDIIAEYNEKATPTQLSIKYGLSIGTIGTIVSAASQEKLLNLSCDTKIKAKKIRPAQYDEIGKHLNMWFNDCEVFNNI